MARKLSTIAVYLLLAACSKFDTKDDAPSQSPAAPSCEQTLGVYLPIDQCPGKGHLGRCSSQKTQQADGSYDWSPLKLISKTSPGLIAHSQSSTETTDAACDIVRNTFIDRNLKEDGELKLHREVAIVHEFPEFEYTELMSKPDESIVKHMVPKLTLVLSTLEPLADWPSQSNTIETIQIPMQNIECRNTHNISGSWTFEPEYAKLDPSTCRKDTNESSSCIIYTLMPKASGCQFHTDTVVFKTLDGTSTEAKISGELKRIEEGLLRGYLLSISAIEPR